MDTSSTAPAGPWTESLKFKAPVNRQEGMIRVLVRCATNPDRVMVHQAEGQFGPGWTDHLEFYAWPARKPGLTGYEVRRAQNPWRALVQKAGTVFGPGWSGGFSFWV